MKLVPAKCPNCGANINVDEEQETTKCEYCGDAILIDKAIQKYQVEIKVSNLPDLENFLTLGERAFNNKDYIKSYDYYNNAILLDPNNYLTILRLSISKTMLDDYNNLDLKQFNNSINNSINFVNNDKEKNVIVNESLECLKEIEQRFSNYYNNGSFNKKEVFDLNKKCLELLSILKDLLSIEEQLNYIDTKKDLLTNIIDFTSFVIKPKVFNTNYIRKNGKASKYSLKLKRKELKKVYDFWNSSINEYNNISENKINNKKLPLIQLDFQTIKLIGLIILILFFAILVIKALFFNNEVFGTYSSPYDCTKYSELSINEVQMANYDKNKLDSYNNKIYNYSGKITSLNLNGDHPYFEIDYKNVKVYINKEQLNNIKTMKIGDIISFCGIIKDGKNKMAKIENATLTIIDK